MILLANLTNYVKWYIYTLMEPICPFCRSKRLRKAGKARGRQRYECKNCRRMTIKPKQGGK